MKCYQNYFTENVLISTKSLHVLKFLFINKDKILVATSYMKCDENWRRGKTIFTLWFLLIFRRVTVQRKEIIELGEYQKF